MHATARAKLKGDQTPDVFRPATPISFINRLVKDQAPRSKQRPNGQSAGRVNVAS
jgi:hypothetical protein